MDRNLGATYCPGQTESLNSENIYAGLGFYYQWGRKDPFFQPKVYNSATSQTQPAFQKDPNGKWELVSEVQRNTGQPESIESSIRKPLVFFNVSQDINNWQNTYTNANEQINDLWGYVGSIDVSGSSFAKTMYDPCPPGYRVMQHNVFKSANLCEADYSSTFRFNNDNDFGIHLYNDLDVQNAQRLDNDPGPDYAWYKVSSGSLWFPNCGAIENSGNFIWSPGHRLSTATPFAGTNVREIRWWQSSDNTYMIQEKHSNKDNYNLMSSGRVVRCQME